MQLVAAFFIDGGARGIARALMREAEGCAAGLGARELVLHVDEGNAAAQAPAPFLLKNVFSQ